MKSNDNLYNYLNEEEFQNKSELETKPYKNRIKEINILLNINGFSEIGDLFDTSLLSVNKTLNTIKLLLDDRIKIMESRAELNKKISKSEEEYINMLEKSEINDTKFIELNSKITYLKNKINTDEKRFKEETDKFKNEKIQAEKVINRLVTKESQYKHEIRKYEKEIEEYKNKLKKIFNDKDAISNPNKTAIFNQNSNLKNSQSNNNATLKSSSQSGNFIDQSHNIRLPVTLHSIIPDFESKNSSKILHNVQHLREFYNLIFNAMNDKINFLIRQNSDMKECYKLIYDELNQFIEFKKLLLYKFAQDSVKDIKQFKHDNSIINFNIFELDFNVSRDTILQNFNDVLNAFRFMFVYEILKVDPANEFDFEEIKKIISNKKFDLSEIPYYAEIKRKIDSYDFKGMNEFKEEMKKYGSSIDITNTKVNKNPDKKKNSKIINNNSNAKKDLEEKEFSNKNKLKALEILEDMNKDIQNELNIFEEKFSTNLENTFEVANENIRNRKSEIK